MADHRLMQQLLMSQDVSEEEMQELYDDLKSIYENPFDNPIEASIKRGNTYIEQLNQYLS